MKIKNILTAMTALVFTAATLPSCEEMLEKEYAGGVMNDDQIGATVEANPGRINASVEGMYALFGKPDSYGAGWANDFGVPSNSMASDMNCADMVNEASQYDWYTVAFDWSDRTPNYIVPALRFGLPYEMIYATKDVLGAIPDDTDNADLKSKRGQALAVRAYAYMSIVPYFQFKYAGNEDEPSVPIARDDVDPRNNPRASMKDMYAFIIDDLTKAINDLDGFQRTSKNEVDQSVAYGLRARAYLNMEKWAEAAADAKKAREGFEPYSLAAVSEPTFCNANDASWIWAIILPAEVINGDWASWPSQLSSFTGGGYTSAVSLYRCINSLLYDKIDDNDIRKQWWLNAGKTSSNITNLSWTDPKDGTIYSGQEIVDAVIGGGDIKAGAMQPYANVKFGQKSGVGTEYNDNDWCLMRAEEMIFIEAEATAKAGKLAEGKALLEGFVKANRFPGYTCTAASVEEFSDEVWFQRRIELWAEGFAMNDVMRLNKNIVRFVPGKTTNMPAVYQFNIKAGDPYMLLRFTQKEMSNNAGIVQNEGGKQPAQGEGADLRDGITD